MMMRMNPFVVANIMESYRLSTTYEEECVDEVRSFASSTNSKFRVRRTLGIGSLDSLEQSGMMMMMMIREKCE